MPLITQSRFGTLQKLKNGQQQKVDTVDRIIWFDVAEAAKCELGPLLVMPAGRCTIVATMCARKNFYRGVQSPNRPFPLHPSPCLSILSAFFSLPIASLLPCHKAQSVSQSVERLTGHGS